MVEMATKGAGLLSGTEKAMGNIRALHSSSNYHAVSACLQLQVGNKAGAHKHFCLAGRDLVRVCECSKKIGIGLEEIQKDLEQARRYFTVAHEISTEQALLRHG